MGINGSYTVILYDEMAQHFLIDNLEAILEFEKDSTKFQGQPWTPQQDYCLTDLYNKNVPTGEIAVTLKRSTSSIHARLKKLGLTDQRQA